MSTWQRVSHGFHWLWVIVLAIAAIAACPLKAIEGGFKIVDANGQTLA